MNEIIDAPRSNSPTFHLTVLTVLIILAMYSWEAKILIGQEGHLESLGQLRHLRHPGHLGHLTH